MRKGDLAGVVLCVLIAATAAAELQNVQVGGELHLRGYWWRSAFNSPVAPAFAPPLVRWPANMLSQRPIGDFLGGQNVMSFWDWDNRGSDYKCVGQRTRLNVSADFTDHVKAFIELDSHDIWGEDFRSNYITGADGRAVTREDVEVFQAFIEADEMFGYPLTTRLGRQEIVLGNGWLMGNNTHRPEFNGLSYDGIRMIYSTDQWVIDNFWAKLMENTPIEEDPDVDLNGLSVTYLGIENVALEGYWLWVRDARSLQDTNNGWFGGRVEDILGIDDYDVTELHTVGLRGTGTWNALDFNAEAAYQFGEAGQVGFLFKPGAYGDDSAKYDAWAGTLELGYTLDVAWQPRVYAGAAYLGGEDNRDISFWEWLNPFDLPKASVSFNRLFSDTSYSAFIDEMGELSNFWTVRGGLSVKPAEKITAGVDAAYLAAVDTFDTPHFWWSDRTRIVLLPGFSFWTQSTDAELGIEAGLWARYQYSEDLMFQAGWSHLFVKDGLSDGNYNDYNGLLFNGGTSNDDADYLYLETKLAF